MRRAVGTDSTESMLTTHAFGTGSSPGSSATSEGSPRTRVVHGATIARRRRSSAADRDNTTTGRRGTAGSSHHHTSPRSVMCDSRQLPRARWTGRPTHRPRKAVAHRRLGTSHRSRPLGAPTRGRAARCREASKALRSMGQAVKRSSKKSTSRRAGDPRPAGHHRVQPTTQPVSVSALTEPPSQRVSDRTGNERRDLFSVDVHVAVSHGMRQSAWAE